MKLHRIAVHAALVLALHGAAGLAQAEERRGIVDLRAARDTGLQRGLEQAVRDLGLEREVAARHLSLALVDVTDGAAPRFAAVNPDEQMYAASLPKVAILLGALVEAERGRIAINDATVGAMTNMIRYSSNEDASRVLGWVGGERMLEILQSDRYRLYEADGRGGLWVGKGYGKEAAFRRDPIANLSHGATAFQVARLYYMLATETLLSPRLNALMKDVLSNPGIHHKFVKGLETRPGARIYRKSGTWRDYHADSALVEYGGSRYIIVGIAEHPDGGDWLRRLAAPLHDLVVPRGGLVAHR
jgi:beta-lactamase class A